MGNNDTFSIFTAPYKLYVDITVARWSLSEQWLLVVVYNKTNTTVPHFTAMPACEVAIPRLVSKCIAPVYRAVTDDSISVCHSPVYPCAGSLLRIPDW